MFDSSDTTDNLMTTDWPKMSPEFMVFPLVSAKILMKAIGNLTQHSPCRHINNRLEVQRDGSPCLGTDYCRCSLYHINIISIRQQVQLCINIYLGNQITVLYSPCPTSSNWASIFASISSLQSLLSTGGKHKERMANYSSLNIDFTKNTFWSCFRFLKLLRNPTKFQTLLPISYLSTSATVKKLFFLIQSQRMTNRK